MHISFGTGKHGEGVWRRGTLHIIQEWWWREMHLEIRYIDGWEIQIIRATSCWVALRHGLHFFCYAGVKYLEQLAEASNKILLDREREKRNKQNRAQPIDGCYVNNGCIVGLCILHLLCCCLGAGPFYFGEEEQRQNVFSVAITLGIMPWYWKCRQLWGVLFDEGQIKLCHRGGNSVT